MSNTAETVSATEILVVRLLHHRISKETLKEVRNLIKAHHTLLLESCDREDKLKQEIKDLNLETCERDGL